ncbi:MAG: TetR/AcrR family transcriptional regulator [Spirochaetota bacterium]
METYSSDSARRRRNGLHQVDARRERILETAQTLFLCDGLEQTSMRSIADAADIAPVTLYRYFPDRHPIAIEIAARMVKRICDTCSTSARDVVAASEPGTGSGSRERDVFCRYALSMVDKYRDLRDAYRYIGLFDHLYAGAYPSRELARLYRRRLREAVAAMPVLDLELAPPEIERDRERMVTLTNVIMSYMEKMSARGILMGREQRVQFRTQMRHFRDYVESILGSEFGWDPERGTCECEDEEEIDVR